MKAESELNELLEKKVQGRKTLYQGGNYGAIGRLL